jgi:hypothetical protein
VRTRRQKAAAPAQDVSKELVQRGGQWCVLSADGSRSFGCYASKPQAEARLAQVESYKAAGALELLDWEPSNGVLPPVIAPATVAKGVMPPLGSSALPASFEAQIPAPFRYWKASTAEEARAVRDDLVERRLIKARDVLVVDGAPTRVLWKAYVAVEDQADAPLAKRQPAGVAAGLRLDTSKATLDGAIRVLDVSDEPGELSRWDEARIQKTVTGVGTAQPFVFVWRTDQVELGVAAKAGLTEFELASRPGLVFGSQLPLAPNAELATVRAEASKSFGVRIVKDAGAEERYVLGVVLAPDVVDSQGDTYSADEVRKAAHGWMEKGAGQLGKQHNEMVAQDKLRVLETYLAPVDFSYGQETIAKGTWLLAIRIPDNELWTAVKSGSFTGFSIGGTAIRTPEPTSPT